LGGVELAEADEPSAGVEPGIGDREAVVPEAVVPQALAVLVVPEGAVEVCVQLQGDSGSDGEGRTDGQLGGEIEIVEIDGGDLADGVGGVGGQAALLGRMLLGTGGADGVGGVGGQAALLGRMLLGTGGGAQGGGQDQGRECGAFGDDGGDDAGHGAPPVVPFGPAVGGSGAAVLSRPGDRRSSFSWRQ
jgi:hypothetical protein